MTPAGPAAAPPGQVKGRFPRTPAEFAAGGRAVVLRCSCGATNWVAPDVLTQRFGPAFDLYDGWKELVAAMSCDECDGRGDLRVSVHVPPPTPPISEEDIASHLLEQRAFWRVRDALIPNGGMRGEQTPKGGRRRRFR